MTIYLWQLLDKLRSGAAKECMRFSCAWDCIIAFSIVSGEIATSIALRTSPFWIAGDTRAGRNVSDASATVSALGTMFSIPDFEP